MAIRFAPLPYPTNELEPWISEQTLEFHHGKHQKHYVETLNNLIDDTPLENAELVDIIHASHPDEPKIFNNAAQVWNHMFYWECLTRPNHGPSKSLERELQKNFGSTEDFKEEFSAAATELFGSGWTWLYRDRKGRMKVKNLANAENPLLDGETPLLVCDVWEHAYYIDVQNERARYLENFWRVVNWEYIEKCMESTLDDVIRHPEALHQAPPLLLT